MKNGKNFPYRNSFLVSGNGIPDYDFAYIRYVRSQNHPVENNPAGYCHYHVGINNELNVKWINEIVEKNNMKIGFTWISENKHFIDYLMNDFLTDEEYVIPLGVKHYSCSQNIVMDPSLGFEKIDGSVSFGRRMKLDEIDKYMWKEKNR